MMKLSTLFGGLARRLAISIATPECDSYPTATSVNNSHATIAAKPTQTAMDKKAGATIIDLSANPDDPSPAINHLVTTVKEARAADQKVILMLGQEHNTTADVRLPELVRQALRAAAIEQPVIALEQPNNLLERALRIYSVPMQAFTALETEDPAHYNHLQAMLYTRLGSPQAPATRLDNAISWLDDGADIRLIDMPRTKTLCLDYADPATAAFIDEHVSTDIADKTKIYAGSNKGMHLRNLFMAAQLRDILTRNDVVILQTGADHLGGLEKEGDAYKHSLHPLFSATANDNIRAITVFPENHGNTFKGSLSADAQAAMNNKDTVILRGANETRHYKNILGSFEEEIYILEKTSKYAGNTPHIKSRIDYYALHKKNHTALKNELLDVVKQYTPHAHTNADAPLQAITLLAQKISCP